MKIETRLDLGQRVYKIDAICTYIIRENCVDCEGVGTIETKNKGDVKCPFCEGRKTRGVTHQQFAYFIKSHTVAGISINVNSENRDERYQMDNTNHCCWDDSVKVIASKADAVDNCRILNKEGILRWSDPDGKLWKQKMYPRHR
jgi:hypothetical protein